MCLVNLLIPEVQCGSSFGKSLTRRSGLFARSKWLLLLDFVAIVSGKPKTIITGRVCCGWSKNIIIIEILI